MYMSPGQLALGYAHTMCMCSDLWPCASTILKKNMENSSSVHTMSVTQFADYLSDKFDEDVIDVMKRNKISGATFLKLSEKQLEKIIPAVGDIVEPKELQIKIDSTPEHVRKVLLLLFLSKTMVDCLWLINLNRSIMQFQCSKFGN